MDWYGNAFAFFGAFLASWVVGSAMLGLCYSYYDFHRRPWQLENWPFSLACSIIPLMIAVLFADIALELVLTEDYRAVPQIFFVICGLILVAVNVLMAVGCWSPRWAEKIGTIARDWRRQGGVWGNWLSQPDNQRYPGISNNFWGWQALWLFLAVFILAGFHGSAWFFESGDVFAWFSRLIARIIAVAREAYRGTFLGDLLGGNAAAPPAQASGLPPIFPRDNSWFWVSLITFVWALFANVVCRFDELAALGVWLWSLVRRKRTPAEVAGVTPPPPTPAPPTEVSPATAPVAPVAASGTSFKRELAKEIGAEAVVSAAGRVLVDGMPIVRRWLRRLGRGT